MLPSVLWFLFLPAASWLLSQQIFLQGFQLKVVLKDRNRTDLLSLFERHNLILVLWVWTRDMVPHRHNNLVQVPFHFRIPSTLFQTDFNLKVRHRSINLHFHHKFLDISFWVKVPLALHKNHTDCSPLHLDSSSNL